MDSVRAMLIHARLPKTFWGPAVLHATYTFTTYARIPLYERLVAMPLSIFLQPCGLGLMLERGKESSSGMPLTRKDIFNEQGFGGCSESDALADTDEPELEIDPDFEGNDNRKPLKSKRNTCANGRPSRVRKTPQRFRNQVSHKWVGTAMKSCGPNAEPNSFDEAVSSPDAELWMRAIEEQLKSLLENDTWEYVDELPPNRNVIGFKWVFKAKTVLSAQTNPDWVLVNNSTI